MELFMNFFIFSILGLVPKIAAGQQNATRINPKLLKAKAETSVTIKCSFKPDANYFSLVWTFGCQPDNVAHHQHYKSRTEFGEFNMEMTISNQTRADSGIYFCRFKSASKFVEAGAILEVITTPDPAGAVQEGVVVSQTENVTAETGKSVTITCLFTSKFPAYSVTWSIGCNSTQDLQDNPCYKRRVKISFPDTVQRAQKSELPTYEGKTTITINNLVENDSGRFCCHIKSGRKTGTGVGTRLEVTPRSFSAGRVCSRKVFLLVEILRVICLIILITFLGIVVKKSC